MKNIQTLWKRISGGQIIADKDLRHFATGEEIKNGYFSNVNGWYCINSHPQYPTHTVLNGELVAITNAKQVFFAQ